jgi:glycosyltransferase involved in cell wall biosynthesis
MSDRVLAVIDHYLPGFRAGGPVRSVANLVHWLGRDFEFRIATRDRDLGVGAAYEQVPCCTWLEVGNAKVWYFSPDTLGIMKWRAFLQREKYDILYLNGFFSTWTIKTLLLRRLGLVPPTPMLLAPRGEFSPGALALRRFKKVAYIHMGQRLGLFRDVLWQASTEVEASDIRRILGRAAGHAAPSIPSPRVHVASNLPPEMTGYSGARCLDKTPGKARIVFLSRLSPKKNLKYALRLLEVVTGEIQFDIYGPVEDQGYWNDCLAIVSELPDNIRVKYMGAVPADRIAEIFSSYHLFLFPTLGENFGHVILEALLAGCPVLISDQTPWRGLADRRSGWDIPLADAARFRRALGALTAMDASTFADWSGNARRTGITYGYDPALVQANRRMFESALSSAKRATRK